MATAVSTRETLFSEVVLASVVDRDPLGAGGDCIATPVRAFGAHFQCRDEMERYLGALSALRRGVANARQDIVSALNDATCRIFQRQGVIQTAATTALSRVYETFALALERHDAQSCMRCGSLVMHLLHEDTCDHRIRTSPQRLCFTCLSGAAHVQCQQCGETMYCSDVCAAVDAESGHTEHVCALLQEFDADEAQTQAAVATEMDTTHIGRAMRMANHHHGGGHTHGLTATKARKILHDKSVKGHLLTPAQRRFFGWVAGGEKPYAK